MISWIKINFTKHEIWALTWAQRLPLFAAFFAGSLWVWPFIPALVAVAVFILIVAVFPNFPVFMNGWPLPFAIVGALVGNAFLLSVAPWSFRWYFISAGLMFGRRKMANKKMEELKRRLAALTASE